MLSQKGYNYGAFQVALACHLHNVVANDLRDLFSDCSSPSTDTSDSGDNIFESSPFSSLSVGVIPRREQKYCQVIFC